MADLNADQRMSNASQGGPSGSETMAIKSEPRLGLHCSFDAGYQAAGWRYVPTNKQRYDTEFVPSEGSYASKGGRLDGPLVPCASDAFAFYRLSFASRFDESGYYAITFQDDAAQDQVDDIYGGIGVSAQWLPQEYSFRGREFAKTLRLQFISHGTIAVRGLAIEQVDGAAVCQWADRLYATLPPLRYQPPDGRWDRIPRTMQRLRGGEKLRVVMLGDSIVNDTNNSNWDALVGRQYPRSHLQAVTSVRGGTACWYYREDEHFKTYVLDRHPDLLIIGGISHRQDLDSIREVICRMQAASHCETLLMSGPMGADWRAHDPTNPAAILPPTAYAGDPFNAKLAALAEETRVGFLDMNALWHQYLGASGKPWNWFHRDTVHANDRGKQILARILERYFAQAEKQ